MGKKDKKNKQKQQQKPVAPKQQVVTSEIRKDAELALDEAKEPLRGMSLCLWYRPYSSPQGGLLVLVGFFISHGRFPHPLFRADDGRGDYCQTYCMARRLGLDGSASTEVLVSHLFCLFFICHNALLGRVPELPH